MRRLRFFCITIVIMFLFLQSSLQSRQLLYVEEFYRLYYWPLYTTKFDARRNLFWLEFALKSPFAPPIQSIIPCKTPKEYEKYKILFKMHLNHLMARSCLALAAQFDVHNPHWYQKPYKDDVIRSLEFARYYYSCVKIYWDKVRQFSQEALEISRIQLDHPQWEDVAFRVRNNKIDLQKLSEKKQKQVDKKIEWFKNL